MKHYKDQDNKVYAYEADGSQDAFIPSHLIRITDEEAKALLAPTPEQLILNQILELESTVTQRRYREALLTDAGKLWLEDVESQIDNLRQQLPAA